MTFDEISRVPVIQHTSNFNECWDSAYDSKSDSENSNSSADLCSQSPINSNSKFTCKWIDCGQIFVHVEDLASHVTTYHANSGPGGLFFCGWEGCGRGNRGFNARYKMLVHVRTHTNEKPHHCYQCDKSFSRAENLKIHARSHTGERPYVCPISGCGKAYSNSSDRFKHTRTHLIDKPYICKIPGCAKRYTDPSSLRKHVKTYRHFPTTQTDKINRSTEENYIRQTKLETPLQENNVTINEEVNQSAFHRIYYPNNNKNWCNVENDLTMEEIKNRVNNVQYEMFRSWFDRESTPYWNNFYNGDDYRKKCFSIEQDMPLDLSVQKH